VSYSPWLGAPVSTTPMTIYVDDVGPEPEAGYIQTAINGASPGDTIIVMDGTYYGTLSVDKSLTIRSQNGSANCTVTQGDSPIFYVTADWVNITGFTVTGATQLGDAGIKLEDVQYCNISANYVHDNYFGIYLDPSANDNTIIDNTCNNNSWYGINLDCSNDNTVENNTCNDNGVGIHLWCSNNNTITNNTCNWHYVGIALQYSDNNTIANNTCNSNYYGIHLQCSNNNTITNCM
jgi:parallel beta-helix repeat protein